MIRGLVICGLVVTALMVAGLVMVDLVMAGFEARGAEPSAQRAGRLVAALTLDEKMSLLHTQFGVPRKERPEPAGALNSAGFNPGVPRLGIPPLEETDAGLGVANPTNAPYDSTALPSSLLLGATFDPDLARKAGGVVGAEARAMGFSVLLGGGADLIREPRGGRNFEYVSEDPLLTGRIAGAEVAGVQSQHVISTLKHFALNAQENGRVVLNAKLAEQPFRESDLLAFEIALEQGRPGAVMAGYNKVEGAYASQNRFLLRDVLKRDWGFGGWVMSDWGGTHGAADAALAGLDQESGQEDDTCVFFDAPLKADVLAGRVPMARLDDMVTRILRAEIDMGLFDSQPHPGGAIDFGSHAAVAESVADRGIVLLKNEGGMLPFAPAVHRLLLVGGHADIGVLSGGGSSQVVPKGGLRFEGEPANLFWGKPRLFDPSSPLEALRRKAPGLVVGFMDGQDRAAAAVAARSADAVVVFADRWANESLDLSGLALPGDQDALIAAVAAANPQTVVVLETTEAVAMPWLGAVRGLLEAWYPGERGGEAIADILLGRIDPSGRLPVSFPARETQLPRPLLPDRAKVASYPKDAANTAAFDVDYNIEGADVGYKWYLRTRQAPLFPFGYGLSYTRFLVSGVQARRRGHVLSVAFDVRNIGSREGIDTPQVYLDGVHFSRRLVGWQRVALAPGERRHVSLDLDPRLTASFDVVAHGWHVAPGRYTLAVRADALGRGQSTAIDLPAQAWPVQRLVGPGADTPTP